MPKNLTMGQRLRVAREGAGLTQEAVRKVVGLKTHSTVTSWEADASAPSIKTFQVLAILYKKPPQWLAFGVKY